MTGAPFRAKPAPDRRSKRRTLFGVCPVCQRAQRPLLVREGRVSLPFDPVQARRPRLHATIARPPPSDHEAVCASYHFPAAAPVPPGWLRTGQPRHGRLALAWRKLLGLPFEPAKRHLRQQHASGLGRKRPGDPQHRHLRPPERPEVDLPRHGLARTRAPTSRPATRLSSPRRRLPAKRP